MAKNARHRIAKRRRPAPPAAHLLNDLTSKPGMPQGILNAPGKRPTARSSGVLRIGNGEPVALTNWSVGSPLLADRDGDVLDPAGMVVPTDVTFTGEWDASSIRVPIHVTPEMLRASSTLMRDFIRGMFAGGLNLSAIPPPPPEHPDLLSLIDHLQSIPPIQFLRWREDAAVIADWLEERGDPRGEKLRAGVTNGGIEMPALRIGNAAVARVEKRLRSMPFDHRLVADSIWPEVVAWYLEEFRYDILRGAGLGHCTRDPRHTDDGGMFVPPWVARQIDWGEISGASIGFTQAHDSMVDSIIRSLGVPTTFIGEPSIIPRDVTF